MSLKNLPPTLKILTINARGLRNKTKRLGFFSWLSSLDFDIHFIQETHCSSKKDAKIWSQEWGGKTLWSFGASNSRGVAILFKRGFICKIDDIVEDKHGRYIKCSLEVNDVKYNVVNVYCPNIEIDRIAFINNFNQLVEQDIDNIIGGDFNCALNNDLDRKNCNIKVDAGQKELMKFIENFDLQDVFRRRNPYAKCYTWVGRNRFSRIDYWLTSKSMDYKIRNVDIKLCPYSDHDAVCIYVNTSETEYGKGVWKMNADILKTDEFINEFYKAWNIWQSEKDRYPSQRFWWDIVKKRLKQLTIRVSTKIRAADKFNELRLNDEISMLRDKKDKGQDVELDLFEKNRELRDIFTKRAKGAFVRSRAQWMEEGETSSRYFHNLEKSHAKEKLWNVILDENNHERYTIKEIMNVQYNFYKQLYSTQNTDKDYSEFIPGCKKLSEESKLLLDAPLHKSEIKKAIFAMKDNKTPGTDGIIIEFYKQFYDHIENELFQVYETVFNDEELCHTQYLAIIRSIYKKGDRKNLKNWRPISLQNVDAKIISKVLAERLKLVLGELISVDQQGCIPGRFIGKNIRLIQDVINEIDDKNIVLLLDQEKAFDRVEWDWLFATLSDYGFGPTFIKWLKIIYKHPKSTILVNGYLTKYFDVTRGIRQGDSLSALLYIIQSEPLSEKIRKCEEIKGITLNGYNENLEVKISQFVDDTTVFLENKSMLHALFNIIDKFSKLSGSKLNMNKCKAFTVSRIEKECADIQITSSPEKILGIYMAKDMCYNKIWENKIKKVESILSVWNMRNLSFRGRIYILKSLGLSAILFEAEMHEINGYLIKKLVGVMFKFIWNNRPSLVKRDICYLPSMQGGLNMFNLSTVIKAKRVKFILRILEGQLDEPWKILPMKYFKSLDDVFGIRYFLLKTTDSTNLINKLEIPQFYKECLLSYQEFIRKTGLFKDFDEIPWCNTNIRFMNECISFPFWSKNGFQSISQIISPTGLVKAENIEIKLPRYPAKYFEISRLKKSIPGAWKTNTFHEKTKLFELSINEILNINLSTGKKLIKKLGILSSKDICELLMRSEEVKIKSFEYWSQKMQLCDSFWSKYFSLCTNNILLPRKILDFNWKIFHGVLNTEKRLQVMKLSNGKCVICNEFESTEHLFCHCNSLETFWNIVEKIIKSISPNIVICDRTKILGYINVNTKAEKSMVINFLISLGRFVIWKRRNCIKYEKTVIDIKRSILWFLNDVKYVIRCLLFSINKCKRYKIYMLAISQQTDHVFEQIRNNPYDLI